MERKEKRKEERLQKEERKEGERAKEERRKEVEQKRRVQPADAECRAVGRRMQKVDRRLKKKLV